MKRILAVIVAVGMLFCFTACGDATDADVEIGTASVAETGAEGLKIVLDNIATLQLGTMGVSLNAAAKAVDLLEWCMATAMTAEQVGDEVTAYITALPEEDKAMYVEQLFTVTNSCESMKDAQYREYMLMDIGYDPAAYDWDDATFEKIAAITKAASVFVTPAE